MELSYITQGLLAAAWAYIFYRVRRMEDKAERAMDEDKTRQLIDDKLEPVRVSHEDIKEDIHEIKEDLKFLVKEACKK